MDLIYCLQFLYREENQLEKDAFKGAFAHLVSTLHCNFLLLTLIEQNQGK
jgi:hypothetical protein